MASSNFPSEEDEFKKAGLSKHLASLVKPSLIKDSPINFECKVNDIVELGQEGGSGNLVICEVLKIHIDEKLFDSENNIDPLKLKIVSRLGGSWYGKTNEESLYKMSKPISKIGVGIDNLPLEIKNSKILSGADLATLASVEEIPNKKNTATNEKNTEEKHILAKELISEGETQKAWQELL